MVICKRHNFTRCEAKALIALNISSWLLFTYLVDEPLGIYNEPPGIYSNPVYCFSFSHNWCLSIVNTVTALLGRICYHDNVVPCKTTQMVACTTMYIVQTVGTTFHSYCM